MGVHVSESGSYRAPWVASSYPHPPHTSISRPLQVAVCWVRATGALTVLIGVQRSVAGSYRAPSERRVYPLPDPPQTIICRPVQTAPCWLRGDGAPSRATGVHTSSAGSYRAPVSIGNSPKSSRDPPQTIISEPVQIIEWKTRWSGAPSMGLSFQTSSTHSVLACPAMSRTGRRTVALEAAAVGTVASVTPSRAPLHHSSNETFGISTRST